MLPAIGKLGYIPEPRSFAENILVSVLTVDLFLVGTELKVGGAIIRITNIGKDKSVKHTYSYEGFSLLADQGFSERLLKTALLITEIQSKYSITKRIKRKYIIYAVETGFSKKYQGSQ